MGGEGSGKSFHAALYAVCKSFYDTIYSSKLYWIIGADYETARKDFEYMFDFQQQLGNVKSYSMPNTKDAPLLFETNTGQIFTTISAYDPTKIAREEPDGIVIAEVATIPAEAFYRSESRLLRKFPRAWGFFSGSFESSLGWLPEIWKLGEAPNERGLRSYKIPSWANPYRYPGGENDPAIKLAKESYSRQRFLERFGGEPAPSQGIVFNEFRDWLHVDRELEFDVTQPIYVAIDPGHKVYCVLWVQITKDNEVKVIDEIYETRWTHEMIINEYKSRPWSKFVKSGAIDVAAKQTHMGMAMPLQEWWKDTGLSLYSQHWSVDDSIDRVRVALSMNPKTARPRLRIHPRCKGLISEMGGGPSPVEGGGPWMYYEGKDGLGAPKPENDHACKALAYLLQAPFGFTQGYKPSYYGPVSYLEKRNG